MTGTDWLEIAALGLSNSLAAFAITVTIATGYLIMAYMVGKKLTTSQLWILNTLFLLVMLMMANGDFLSLKGAMQANYEAGKLVPGLGADATEYRIEFAYFSYALNLLIIGGCFKFMWDIRSTSE
jgi:hypothetical protein